MYKNSTPWDKLSMAERSDVMNLAIKQGITNLDDIRATYNSFGNGGDKKSKSSYIHDVLPELLRKAGLNIRVTSGYRPAGAVGTAGSKSWHPRHGAVDIVPQGYTTFEDIERVVTTNPKIVRYMTSNGFGFLDETNRTAAGKALMKKTGATGNHFHFGKDTSARNRYQKLLSNTQIATQPSVNTVLGPSTATIETQFPQTYTLPTPAPVQMYTPNPLPTPDLEAIEDFYKTTAEKRARREALTSMLTPQQPVAYIPQVQVPQSFLAHPMLQAGNAFGDGGSIHIKPSHRGRLTELKKRTGKSEAELYNDGNPAHKKMVVFARNARKWKHAFGGPLVDAANAHIYDGTTEDSQQMNNDYIFTGAPSQYDFQVTAKAPTVYWDGFNWIGFNDLGQRVTKGPNFNPSGARIIENPQEFENARLAQARRTDINGTHRFAEDIRNFTTDLVLMPAGDVLAEPIGILGGKALSAAAKTKAGKAALKGIENIVSKFAKGRTVTPAEQWAVNTPQITPENAASITPEQWTAAQDAATAKALNITPEEAAFLTEEQFESAIANGADMAEVERLRYLHGITDDYHFGYYHETGEPFNSFNKPGKNSYGDLLSPFGVFTKSTDKAIGLGDYQMPLIVRYKNPLHVKNKKELFKLLPEDLQNEIQILYKYQNNNTDQALWNKRAYMVKQRIGKFLGDNGYDALKIDEDWAGTGLVPAERWTDATIVPSPGNVKSPSAITFDDNGRRIALGERDNFNINDKRYGWLPWLLGGTTAGYLYNKR